jgi:hypothetical protein
MPWKPNYKIVKTDGETDEKSTVGRHATGEAAAQARLDKRAGLPFGSSDSLVVDEIKHRAGR